MKKSTTRIISMFLAFLIAFTSVNVPSMATPIEIGDVSEEAVIINEEVADVLQGEEEVIAEELDEISGEDSSIEEDAITTSTDENIASEDETDIIEEIVEEALADESEVVSSEALNFFDEYNYEGFTYDVYDVYQIDESSMVYPMVINAVIPSDDFNNIGRAQKVIVGGNEHSYEDNLFIRSFPSSESIVYADTDEVIADCKDRVLTYRINIPYAWIDEIQKVGMHTEPVEVKVVFDSKNEADHDSFTISVKAIFHEWDIVTYAVNTKDPVFNLVLGGPSTIRCLYTSDDDTKIERIELGNGSEDFELPIADETIFNIKGTGGDDEYWKGLPAFSRIYPQYNYYIDSNRYTTMHNTNSGTDVTKSIVVTPSNIEPGIYSMRVTLTNGEEYEYINGAKVSYPEMGEEGIVFAQEKYYANDLYRFNNPWTDYEPCDGKTSIFFGVDGEKIIYNGCWFLFIDGEDEDFKVDVTDPHCSWPMYIRGEIRESFLGFKRELAPGEHTYRLYYGDYINPKNSRMYQGEFTVEKIPDIAAIEAYYSSTYSHNERNISFSGTFNNSIANEKFVSAKLIKHGEDSFEKEATIHYSSFDAEGHFAQWQDCYETHFEFGDEVYDFDFAWNYDTMPFYAGRTIYGNIDISFENMPCGKYDVELTTSTGKKYLIKNQFAITDAPIVRRVETVPESGCYMTDPADGYVAVVVYGNNFDGKLPKFYSDEALSVPAFTYDENDDNCAKVFENYKAVFKVKKAESDYAGKELYLKYDDPETVYDCHPALSDNETGNNKAAIFEYDEADDYIFPLISLDGYQMMKLYMGKSYSQYIEAESIRHAELKAEDFTNHKTFAETFEILMDNAGRYYINVPVTSECYKALLKERYNTQMTVALGEKRYSFGYNYTYAKKYNNLITNNQTLVIRDTMNMSDIILEVGENCQGLDIDTIEKLAAYPCVTMQAFEDGYLISTMLAVFDSPARDNIIYATNGGEYEDGEGDPVYLYKGQVLTLKNPVRAHYTFGGWYTDSAYKTRPVTSLVGAGGKNVTLYAKWIPKVYKFAVYDDDGTVKRTFEVKYPESLVFDDSTIPVLKKGYENRVYELKLSTSEGFFALIRNGQALDLNGFNEDVVKFLDENDSNAIIVKVRSRVAKEYKINYQLNGGIKSDEWQSIYSTGGDAYTLPEPLFSNDFYAFDGWYTDAEFRGEPVTELNFADRAEDINLYAKWKVAKNITVTFEMDDLTDAPVKLTSTKSMPELTVSLGEIITLPANVYSVANVDPADRSKWVFVGWDVEIAGAPPRRYADKSKVLIDESMLQRVWSDGERITTNNIVFTPWFENTVNQYNIHYYDLSSDDPVSKIESYTFGTAKKLNSYIPKRDGYIFLGWEDQETKKIVTALSAKDYDDKYYVAQWKPKEYQIIFNANGGSGKNQTVKYSYDDTLWFIYSQDLFKKAGSELIGWEIVGFTDLESSLRRFDTEDGVVQIKEYGDLANNTKITFKAIWEPINYTITYHSIAEDRGGTYSSKYFYNTKAQNIMAADMVDGKTFVGWYYDEACTKLASKYNAKSKTAALGAKVSGNLDLYAKWETGYSVRLNGPNGVKKIVAGYKEGVKKALPANPFKSIDPDNKIFRGWSANPDADVYYCADKALISPQIGNGLVYDEALGIYVLDLYPMWSSTSNSKYTIVYKGGEYHNVVGTMPNQTIVYGKTTALAKNKFTRTDAVFAGWIDQYGNEYAPGEAINGIRIYDGTVGDFVESVFPEEPVEMTAQWRSSFEISFNENHPAAELSHKYKYSYGSAMNAAVFANIYVPQREGYTFGGWYLDSACRKAFNQIAKNTSGDITLYAKWNPMKYTLTFSCDPQYKYKGTTKNVTFVYGKAATVPKCGYSIPGMKFGCWEDAVTHKIYMPGDKITNLEGHYPDGGVRELIARWAEIDYTLTKVDSLSGETKTITYNTNRSTPVTEPNGMTGYAFAGWYTDAKFKKPFTITDMRDSVGNKTIYAKWIKVK